MKKFVTKILAGVFGLVLCVCTLTLVGCGKKDSYDENAIVISNYQELKTFLEDFSQKDYDDAEISNSGKYLVISKNIDCGGEVLTPLLSQDYYGLQFKIDGDGHKISNFKLDESCVRAVGTAAGSSTAYYNVLSLFPISAGGTLQNIEFENVTFELKDYDIGANANAIQVGLVGYSRSSGADMDFSNPENTTSTYKNVKLSNIKFDITTSTPSTATKYCFAVGALIGLDADTTQYGTYIGEETPKAIRENITVTNLDVNIDLKGGTVFFGGISGMSNWETVSYKNCNVAGNVQITNQGADEEPSYVRGQLGNIVSAGGLCGGTIKGEYGIAVDNCNTAINYVVNSKNPESLVNVGRKLGLVFTSSLYNSLEINANNVDASTLKANTLSEDGQLSVEGTVSAVELEYIEK